MTEIKEHARLGFQDSTLPTPQEPGLDIYQVGSKLRSLRTGKRFTLSRLAHETGFSTALLSKLETDRMVPTLPTLSKISRVYGVSLSYFFSDSVKHSVSITRKADKEPTRQMKEAVRRVPLHAMPITATSVSASLLDLPSNIHCAATDPGQGFSGIIYVLNGSLRLDIGTSQEVLDAGDSACIDTDMMVVWGSASHKESCQVLFVKS